MNNSLKIVQINDKFIVLIYAQRKKKTILISVTYFSFDSYIIEGTL